MWAKIISKCTQINKWLAFLSLIVMMIIVAFSAISRGLGSPIVGDVELVQLTMVTLIVGALSYTENLRAHISVGILADHFPIKVQYVIDLISSILITIFAFLVAYVFFIKFDLAEASIILRIPFFYFKALLIFGFIGWGFESIKQIVGNIKLLTQGK
ncbi:TRAP transporter small permease subunit [Cytobacillus kochii]|uniref:TRAP transporter small permease n=1 Tax=Cytobacillus kochii TaxID=859143 RepID=UPI002E1B74B7|nr:TRAP transporter small permease subunit [Cytobacillus kochii]